VPFPPVHFSQVPGHLAQKPPEIKDPNRLGPDRSCFGFGSAAPAVPALISISQRAGKTFHQHAQRCACDPTAVANTINLGQFANLSSPAASCGPNLLGEAGLVGRVSHIYHEIFLLNGFHSVDHQSEVLNMLRIF